MYEVSVLYIRSMYITPLFIPPDYLQRAYCNSRETLLSDAREILESVPLTCKSSAAMMMAVVVLVIFPS
jgi:hypothetical protein